MSGLGGVNGTVCSAQEYEESLSSPNPSLTCLTHGQSIGLTIVAETSLLSIVCVMVIFVLYGRNILRYRKALPDGGWRWLQTPADIYLITLFFFDILQALGGALNVRWAHDGIVTTGSYCAAQGIIQQTGELGVALTTLLLTTHSFVTALWSVGIEARGVAFGLVVFMCAFIGLWVGLGDGLNKNYEAPTPYWCWISDRYNKERMAGEYVWIWVALFASIVLNIPVFLWATGRLFVDKKRPYFHLSFANGATPNRATLRLLIYPVAYALVVLPTSIARWLRFSHHPVSSASQFFGAAMFNLSGAVNVLLFLVSQSELLLFAPPVEPILVMQPGSPEPEDQGPQPTAVDHANGIQLRDLPLSQSPDGSRNSARDSSNIDDII
ncbi:hypothetical protein BGW80DRAFT_1442629 [Lactifluus volemus]|nr:hypothetical protein BGW80DRAFT_1442629 [Lactifluus volemus]